ncbi:Membrane-associated kinase regulator 5-like protein [Drosera capensis]
MESQQDPLKQTTATPVATAGDEIATKEPTVSKLVPKECNEDDNDDNESWFELELTFPKPPDSSKSTTNPPRNHTVFCKADTDSDLGCSKRRASTTSTSSDDSTISTTSFYRDHHHIRRMDSPDVRLSTEKSPRSPISILRAPTLRGLMFGVEHRSVKEGKAETYSNSAAATPSRSWSRRGVGFFSVRFRIEDVSKYRRCNSSRSNRSSTSRVSIPERRSVDDGEASSRRLMKYLNFLRPLYLKVSEKDKLKVEFGVGVPSAAGIGSPARRGWMWSPMRATTKQREERRGGSRFGGNAMKLSKSRSASSSGNAGVGFSPASRKDDSMKQQKDGIEGAILHCKQSLNSSSERSCALERCTSDSASNGKSLQRL